MELTPEPINILYDVLVEFDDETSFIIPECTADEVADMLDEHGTTATNFQVYKSAVEFCEVG